MRDRKDLPILITAVEYKNDILVSNDKHFTSLQEIIGNKPFIMSTTDFYRANVWDIDKILTGDRKGFVFNKEAICRI